MVNAKMKKHLLRSRSLFNCLNTPVRQINVEAKIESLGLKLPQPAVPKGSFVNFVIVDNLAYLSGHLPQVTERFFS